MDKNIKDYNVHDGIKDREDLNWTSVLDDVSIIVEAKIVNKLEKNIDGNHMILYEKVINNTNVDLFDVMEKVEENHPVH